MFILFLPETEYMIASGGDDNALHIVIINLSEDQRGINIVTKASGSRSDAHATQITGKDHI